MLQLSPKKLYIIVAVVVIIAIFYSSNNDGLGGISLRKNSSHPSGTIDKKQYSISNPNSIWVIVNKTRPINPSSFTPSNLVTPKVPIRNPDDTSEVQVRKDTAVALQDMFDSAKKDTINLVLASGYRSYKLQAIVYESFVKLQGQKTADAQSARPGFSEHQLGLAADIVPQNSACQLEVCFADTPEGKWLASNAHLFGFLIRYGKDQKNIVGYQFEPWHVRYVGKELAKEVFNEGNTPLEVFFDLPPAPDYK